MEHNALLPLVSRQFGRDLPGAVALLETLPDDEAAAALLALPTGLAADAVRHMPAGYAAALLESADTAYFAAVASALDPKLAAAVFMHLPAETKERFSAHLPDKLKLEIREILTYPEDSIGRLMTTDFLSFNKDMLVSAAIDRIRELARRRFPASYAYVVDDAGVLVGVINMRDLMLAPGTAPLETVMRTGVFSMHGFMDSQQAATEISKRRFFAAPVVDGQNRMVGIIRAETLLHDIREDAGEDLQKLFGASEDERTFSPLRFSIRKRLPWLSVNLATAFLAAAVVALFEGVISRVTILAVFLPVIAGQGGNAGAQSLVIVIRGLVMREIPRDKFWPLIVKEGALGAVNGVFIGLVTAVVAYAWHGNPWLGLVIGLGMVVNMVVAGIAGATIPIALKAARFDPALGSSIILTTVTDVMGFLAFLGLALIFQGRLVQA